MAQTGRPTSGKNGRVQVNGVNLKAKVWQVGDSAEYFDTTNFECNGFGEGVFGIFQADVSIDMDWDMAQNPFDNPPNFKKGQILSSVILYISVTNIQFYSFPKLAIITCNTGCPVRGVVSYSITSKSDGTYTEPTGSIA